MECRSVWNWLDWSWSNRLTSRLTGCQRWRRPMTMTMSSRPERIPSGWRQRRARSTGSNLAATKRRVARLLFPQDRALGLTVGFVPILDFVHALTHVYAAAMAGNTVKDGWPVYVRWIAAIWGGKTASVIAELATRQQVLGLPTEEDGDTSPRKLVTKTPTYLQN